MKARTLYLLVAAANVFDAVLLFSADRPWLALSNLGLAAISSGTAVVCGDRPAWGAPAPEGE